MSTLALALATPSSECRTLAVNGPENSKVGRTGVTLNRLSQSPRPRPPVHIHELEQEKEPLPDAFDRDSYAPALSDDRHFDGRSQALPHYGHNIRASPPLRRTSLPTHIPFSSIWVLDLDVEHSPVLLPPSFLTHTPALATLVFLFRAHHGMAKMDELDALTPALFVPGGGGSGALPCPRLATLSSWIWFLGLIVHWGPMGDRRRTLVAATFAKLTALATGCGCLGRPLRTMLLAPTTLPTQLRPEELQEAACADRENEDGQRGEALVDAAVDAGIETLWGVVDEVVYNHPAPHPRRGLAFGAPAPRRAVRISLRCPERAPITGTIDIGVTFDAACPPGVAVEIFGSAVATDVGTATLEEVCRRGGVFGVPGRVWRQAKQGM
ncbi:uncharacterized protein BXZ73DRAFT_106076 [Epithele typhae]|uniref:uncharacterized protein n=1 Tax=Epithele typhae TaxID=378194 RepID=UPI0020074EE2|nr:uncharacterized protein BXZ73DRAFT_106076 [Epithele typhae]KAH9915797.1 hypothetical protein BXZ73DRAFT_106076 [Epithele typhae]